MNKGFSEQVVQEEVEDGEEEGEEKREQRVQRHLISELDNAAAVALLSEEEQFSRAIAASLQER